MTLHLDPSVQDTFDEPPYSDKREKLYAPSAPFGEAVDRWLDHQQRQIGIPVRDARHSNHGNRNLAYWGNDIAGLKQLAELAGMDARQISRYRKGTARFIELGNADRLALALDIPLPLLAENFRTMSQMLADSRRMREMAA